MEYLFMDPNELVPLNEVVKMIPRRNNNSVHISTLHRWRSVGLKGIKLESIRIGGIYYTTKTALNNFLNNINKKQISPVPRDYEEAIEDELRKLGFK